MKPNRLKSNKPNQYSLYRELTAQFYKKNHLPFIIAVLSALLLGLLSLMLSWLIQQLIDTISGVPGSMDLSSTLLLSLIVILLVILFKLMDCLSRPRFLKKAVQQYKDLAFRRLTQKSISSFQEESTATYISAMSNDIASIEQNLLENQFALAANGILFFGSVFMMLSYSPLLTAASALLSFLPFLGSMAAGDRMKTAETRVSKQNEQFVASLKDSLSGFSVIKSFKAEAPILELFSKSNQAAEDAKCRRRKLEAFLGMIGSAAGVTAQLGVFLIGAYLALTGSGLTPGTVLVFVNLMNFIIDPITQMPTLLANRKAALALIRKLSDALEEHSGRGGQAIQSRLTHGILLDHVSFSYEPGIDVLHDLTFRFESGKSYALVESVPPKPARSFQSIPADPPMKRSPGIPFFDGSDLIAGIPILHMADDVVPFIGAHHQIEADAAVKRPKHFFLRNGASGFDKPEDGQHTDFGQIDGRAEAVRDHPAQIPLDASAGDMGHTVDAIF